MLSMTRTKCKDKTGKPKKVSANKGHAPTGLSVDLCGPVEKDTTEDFAKADDLVVLTTSDVVVIFDPIFSCALRT